MIHPGRVGSTVVAKSLSDCPIYLGGEIHNQVANNISAWEPEWNYIDLFKHTMEASSKKPFSQYGSEVKYPSRLSTYLFEYKPFHGGRLPPIDKAIHEFCQHGVTHYIFLYRKNYIRRYVSYLISASSGIWHTRVSPDNPHKVMLDTSLCRDSEIGFKSGNLIGAIDHYYNDFVPSMISAISKKNHLILTYEDHVEQDPNVAFKLIKEFLGIHNNVAPVDCGFKRQNAFPLKDIIENYDQVAEVLSSSGYGHLLY